MTLGDSGRGARITATTEEPFWEPRYTPRCPFATDHDNEDESDDDDGGTRDGDSQGSYGTGWFRRVGIGSRGRATFSCNMTTII